MNQLILSGTYRADRHATRISLPIAIPEPPCDLSARASEIWIEVANQAARLGTIAEVDAVALRLLSESLELYEQASRAVRENGVLIKTTIRGGHECLAMNPALRVRAQAWKQCVDLLAAFGLTPRSRATLDIPAMPTPEDAEQAAADAILRKYFD